MKSIKICMYFYRYDFSVFFFKIGLQTGGWFDEKFASMIRSISECDIFPSYLQTFLGTL